MTDCTLIASSPSAIKSIIVFFWGGGLKSTAQDNLVGFFFFFFDVQLHAMHLARQTQKPAPPTPQPKTVGHVPLCKDQDLHTARWMAAGPAAAAAAATTTTTTALQLVVLHRSLSDHR